MNLRAIANGLTQAINPNVTASWQRCNGYARDASYAIGPTYDPAADILVQPQALSKREVEHLDSLNLSNATRAVYANVQLTGVDRNDQSGGDLLTYADPASGKVETWLVIAVLEAWSSSGWTKAAVAKQVTR